jgi:hypothetical protein
MNTGLLVVDCSWLYRRALPAGTLRRQPPALDLDPEDVFERYRGFDGQAWPNGELLGFVGESGLAPITSFAEVLGYMRLLPTGTAALIAIGESPGGTFQLAGFDVGAFLSRYAHFSVLLNEVIFGTLDELRGYAGRLNSNLLMPSAAQAQDLLALRARLHDSGADLEDMGVQMEPVPVYTVPRS